MFAVSAAGVIERVKQQPSRWLLPDDGIIDELAVNIAATGTRAVALTEPERRLAAERILANGGSVTNIFHRLHMDPRDATALAEEIRRATPANREAA